MLKPASPGLEGIGSLLYSSKKKDLFLIRNESYFICMSIVERSTLHITRKKVFVDNLRSKFISELQHPLVDGTLVGI
jgi:hypothetical protein